MNINTEKENLFSLSVQPDAYSPYLSPLMAHNNSKEFQEQEQLIDFHLEKAENQAEYYSHEQNIRDLNLDLLIEHKSSHDEEFIEYEHPLELPQKRVIFIPSKKDSTKIYSIINFLIDNDELPEAEIKQAGKSIYQQSPMLDYIFSVMITKFKKLRKTKQQMTKFCMRKAFKFVSDHQIHTRKKRKSIKEDQNQQQNFDFQMPFRKNSTEKTMNSQFLKQVFSKGSFVQEYEKFLKEFRSIITRDNQYKIKYLSDTIEEYITSDNIKKIQQIKRLPWTRSILTKTQQLAFSLLKFAQQKEDQFGSDKQ